MSKKALFLDRDGTLIIDKHYLKDPDEVELFSGTADFLKEALSCGYLLFLFSNQSGISRGYSTMDDARACNQRMFELLGLPESAFIDICIATELPSGPQLYRKPSPRFILEMIERHNLEPKLCWMVGDQLSDLEAGINAGINSAWVSTGKPRTRVLDAYIEKHSIPELSSLADLLTLAV